MKHKVTALDNQILDTYEQELENSIPENLEPVHITEGEKREFLEIAKRHRLFMNSKRINIRIKNSDLIKVKAKAKENGIPYQTLISTLVHKYASEDIQMTL